MTSPRTTKTLIQNCLDTTLDSIPAGVLANARLGILNWLGATLGGVRQRPVEILRGLLVRDRPGSSGPSSIVGGPERVDALTAALINGVSSHVLDFDDTHLPTVHHPSGPVLAAALALAEQLHSTGEQLLLSYTVGAEAELRVARAITPSHYDDGWHITSTTGVFGAAVATSLLSDADPATMEMALGIAASESAGLRAAFGTMTKSLHVGRAAQSGLLATLLARRGFTGPANVLETPRGFIDTMAQSARLEAVNLEWGEHWEIAANTFKPYPCGIVIHPVIEGCIALARRSNPDTPPDSLEIVANPYVLELTGIRAPRTSLETKFSAYHAAAAAYVYQDGGLISFSQESLHDPRVASLRDRVRIRTDPSMDRDSAALRARFADGSDDSVTITHAVGSLDRPMPAQDVEHKLRMLAHDLLSTPAQDALITAVRDLETVPDVQELTAVIREGLSPKTTPTTEAHHENH